MNIKHKTRRVKRFFQSFSAISLLLSSIATNGMANELSTSKQKPNVILIVLDNAAYSDLGVYGGEIETPNKVGKLDETLIMLMSDNGANKTTMEGYLKMAGDDPAHNKRFDNSLANRGRPNSNIAHGPAWAYGMSAPFRLMKGYQTQGGILTPLIIKPPKSLKVSKSRSDAIVHVMDIMPTVVELTEAKHPASRSKSKILPMQGISLLPLLEDRNIQAFDDRSFGAELFGIRAYRSGDWKIVKLPPPYGSDQWRLYNLATDPGETVDLAKKEKEKLKKLVAHWEEYAKANGVVEPNRPVSYAKPPE